MDLGVKEKSYETSLPASPDKPKDRINYPTCTIKKALGNGLDYNDEFTAVVKFRVKNVEHGEGYGQEERHSCELEMISMDQIKPKAKGLPQHGGSES